MNKVIYKTTSSRVVYYSIIDSIHFWGAGIHNIVVFSDADNLMSTLIELNESYLAHNVHIDDYDVVLIRTVIGS